mgnify:CR=1 FL=1
MKKLFIAILGVAAFAACSQELTVDAPKGAAIAFDNAFVENSTRAADLTANNITDFGVFVDIGVHQDGLVHVSQISDRFIKHPSEALKVGDVVTVKVLGVDLKKKRISLTMKGIK